MAIEGEITSANTAPRERRVDHAFRDILRREPDAEGRR